MILQCEQCKARFKLDDEKIKSDGVKVRCSKCKHVFFVKKETAQDEADFDTILSGLGSSVQPPPAPPAVEEGHLEGFAEQSPVPEEPFLSVASLAGEEDAGAFSFNDEMVDTFVTPPAAHAGQEFDAGEFSFDEPAMPSVVEQGGAAHAEHAGSLPDTDFPAQFTGEDGESQVPLTAGGDEFTFDFDEPSSQNNSGEFSSDEKVFAGSSIMEENTETAISFEPEEPAFSMETAEFSSKSSSPENPSPLEFSAPEQPKSAVPETFVLDSFTFGEEADAPVPEKKASNLSAVKDDWGLSPVPSTDRETILFPEDNEPLPDSDEIPPFPSTPRRSGFSPFPLTAIIFALLFVLGISAIGFYFVKSGPAAFNQLGLGFVTNWLGMTAAEEGGIVISKSVAAFQQNKEVGELFVVRGEAVNNFTKSRASIHIKVTLFDNRGRALLHKGAYCGNRLSSEQLATLPMAKIDEAMNNQFGDSLSNLGVKPGKGLPFVVAFANVPPEAVDFAVEVTGSTVASQ
jgi:predicted Zn finger-like uncharacterized protein